MTYVPTWASVIFLAIVLYASSRRVAGWASGEQMNSDLVLSALNMALQQRKPREVIHHGDHGSHATSLAFGQRCKTLGVRPSMGRLGEASDTAMAKRFRASLEWQLINRRSFESKAEAGLAVFAWIEDNPRRRHCGLGSVLPIDFECSHVTGVATPSDHEVAVPEPA